MNDHVHIVCLDAPSPPDYGGAIDMFYKITSLAATGKKIILHYFDYRENRNAEMIRPYCTEIHTYKRNNFLNLSWSGLPYIVRSRKNKLLASRLNEDKYPVILEGLHCTGLMPWLNKEKKVIIRMHNEEGTYYRRLAASERSIFKSAYMSLESILADRYMTKLPKDIDLAAVSISDGNIFRDTFGFRHVHFIPPFIPWQELKGLPGKGEFCLYHGNMKVSENVAAAKWLADEVFSKLKVPLVIAGSGMPAAVFQLEKKYNWVQVINNPPMDQLNQLVATAQINVLPSLNQTGVKLKLLHSLFTGRFCITNQSGVSGTGINQGVYIGDDVNDYLTLIPQLFNKEFSKEDLTPREILLKTYDNSKNAAAINELL